MMIFFVTTLVMGKFTQTKKVVNEKEEVRPLSR